MTKALWVLIAALLPGVAVAQPVQGLYFGGSLGANVAPTLHSAQQTTRIDTAPGPIGSAAAGWGFGNGLRVELEGSYRSNSVNDIATRRQNGLLRPLGNVTGTAATYAIMANMAYDIPIRPFGLQPYAGAGVGYGWLNLDGVHGNGFAAFVLPANNAFASPDVVSFGTGGAFAYQAMAGASFPWHAVPGIEFTAEYRLFGMARSDIPVTRVTATGDTANGAVQSSSTHNGFELLDSAVLIGLRYRFGGPH